MMQVFKGPMIDVYLLPGSMTIEFKHRTILEGNPYFSAHAFIVIEYDDIEDVYLENDILVLKLNDGSKVKLEVDDVKNLYEHIKRIVESIRE